ncbi:MAG: hypothetical protein ACMUEL_06320 [Flavobacteriales bacterium Tduv]
MEDHITYCIILCKFRNEIIAKKTYESLLKKINKKLEKNQAIVNTGVLVGSSIILSSFFPKGGPNP